MTSQLAAHLVAFASRVDQRRGGPAEDERRTSDSKKLNTERVHAILDSLASICVRRGKGEVYAIAIQLNQCKDDTNGGTIALTVAGNDNVPEAVVEHLKKVWYKLKDISHQCHQFYTKKREEKSMQYRGESPDSAAALSASKELVLELMEMVYRHSLEKFTSRVNKRYSKFQDWFKELSAYVEKQDLNQLPDSHLWDDLQCVAIGLEEVEELLRAHTATTLPFIELIETMSILAESIHKLVRSRSVLAWPLLVPGKFKHIKTV
jgi:hypothetical protein